MRREVEVLIKRLAELFEARDAASLAEYYSAPLPFFYGEGVKLNVSKSKVHRAMVMICQGLDDIDATEVRCRILDLTQRPGTNTISVLVDFDYRNASAILRKTRVRYFLERSEEGLRIVMAEFLEMAFPHILRESLS